MIDISKYNCFDNRALIGDRWCDADDKSTMEVTNPFNMEVIDTVPKMGADEVARAIDAASAAQEEWSALMPQQRADLMMKWYDLIMENLEELSHILVLEQGKPLAEAEKEITYGASFLKWFAAEARRAYGDIIPSSLPGTQIRVSKEPVGVVGIIIPWNFPSAMVNRKVSAALAAGCSCVIKPSELTPYSAIALLKLAQQAGISDGVLNIVTGEPDVIGKELTANPKVKKISFTGSTKVGKLIMAQAAPSIKKLSLELGGNAPFVIFADADLDAAVAGLIASKYRNSGQTCVCANRVLVQESVYDEFIAKLEPEVNKLKMGDGLADGTTQGPLINEAALKKVERHVADMLDKGASLVCGGKRAGERKNFYEPTIIADVKRGSLPCHEETFGPVAPIYKFDKEEEAIEIANDTQYGLSAYFYTKDLGRAHRVSQALENGIVGVNCGIISNEVSPFGGVKESGLGREGSKYGLDEYLNIKYTLFTY